jgi:DNA polymerase-1
MTPSSNKKLFLLDAFALIYRAYFAFSNNHRINSKGLNTSAVFGFANTLLEVLKKEEPTHIAVVFDTAAPTQRHEEFESYKANREEMPEDLALSLPYIHQLLHALNIPVILKEGYEADDLIGTLARKAENNGFVTYMMTPDKDYGQLVDTNTFIYKPARLGNGVEILGTEEICKKWEIKNVNQLIDILGLMGDKVDNIPGIPGVGEKTAIQLIKDFDSVENLLQNTDKLKGKLKEKVENNKELALLSKKLATIMINAPIEFNEAELVRKDWNKEALRNVLTELEFRQLAQRLLGEEIQIVKKEITDKKKQQPGLFDEGEAEETSITLSLPDEENTKPLNTIHNVSHEYILCDTKDKIEELVLQLKTCNEYCFDTETTGLDSLEAELVGLSFSLRAFKAYYIPVSDNKNEALQTLAPFREIFNDVNKTLIGQNIKYDLHILLNYGIEVKNRLFDTMVAHFILHPEGKHNMNAMANRYLQYEPVSIETLIGKRGKDQMSMRMVPLEQICDYAAEDADVTLQLKNVLSPEIEKNSFQKLLNEVELPLIPVLTRMEREGIRIDVKALNDFSTELEKDISAADEEIQNLAGTKFNISSPKQVGEILFDYLKIIDKPKKTKTGQYSTNEETLQKLLDKHPIVNKILDYRELVKLKNTYVDALPDLVNKNTGRIHTTYNQVVAVTGRLSSDNPNLQNIPIRTDKGREIRKAFIPRNDNFIILSADYSQIELRIMAALSRDAGMLEAFHAGFDIHQATAAKVYSVELDRVTAEMRRNAKMVNFGIIYGISAFGLAERLNIARKEAAEIIDSYWREYPGVKKYMQTSVENAKKNGYVETVLGRRRYLRDINSSNAVVRGFAERNAINAPIQGSAADMIKIAMIEIDAEMRKRNLNSKMLLQVHDELVFDVLKAELEEVKILVENKMKNAIELDVPMEVGMGIGENWLKAH